MKRTALCNSTGRQLTCYQAALVTILLGALVTAVHADPVGTGYGLELTLFRPAEPFPLALERHAAEDIPFDETEKIGVLTHLAPNPDVDNDLNVTEMATPTATGKEITIWIEGQKLLPGGRPVPLFAETEPQDGDGVRFVLENLFWTNFNGPANMDNLIFFETTFPNPSVSILPTDVTISGAGTAANPLSIQADFDASDFNLNGMIMGMGIPKATGFQVSFTVKHFPEPSTLVLAALVLLGLVGHRWRRQRTSTS